MPDRCAPQFATGQPVRREVSTMDSVQERHGGLTDEGFQGHDEFDSC